SGRGAAGSSPPGASGGRAPRAGRPRPRWRGWSRGRSRPPPISRPSHSRQNRYWNWRPMDPSANGASTHASSRPISGGNAPSAASRTRVSGTSTRKFRSEGSEGGGAGGGGGRGGGGGGGKRERRAPPHPARRHAAVASADQRPRRRGAIDPLASARRHSRSIDSIPGT